MPEESTQGIISEVEQALRKALEPFLHSALIPGGILGETNKVQIKRAANQAVQSVLQKLTQQKASMSLQSIKDATTKETFGDPERNWLISECDRLTRIVEKAVSVLRGQDWCPQAGTNKGRVAELAERKEDDSVEQG